MGHYFHHWWISLHCYQCYEEQKYSFYGLLLNSSFSEFIVHYELILLKSIADKVQEASFLLEDGVNTVFNTVFR